MKARVTSLNKDKGYMEIDLINSNGDACLHTQVCCRESEDIRIYYTTVYKYYDSKKQRCVFVRNIGKIIGKAFLILGYDESEIESIVFNKSEHSLEYASITFRKD
jgi:hypothetical protein